MTSLIEINPGQSARLISVKGNLRLKLIQYGLHVTDCVRVVRVAPLGGPLLIHANGREIALGRTIAENILVEPECGSR